MSQAYSDPKRDDDPHALPDLETFEIKPRDMPAYPESGGPGWYWQSCFPGCLPDSDPVGPFETEAEALADAREGMDLDDDEESED